MSPLKYPLTITKSVHIWGQLFGAGCLGLVVWSRLIGADWAVFFGNN